MKPLSSCLPTVQYNQTWSSDYFSVLFEKKKKIWLPNPGFCFSCLWILGVQKCFLASMPKQSILCAQKWISSNSPWPRSVCWYNGGEILQWGWEEGALFLFFLTSKVDQRHAALAHSYLYRMLLKKNPTYLSNIFGDFATIRVFSALFPTFYTLKHKVLVFTSKALPHQTASF